MVRLRRRGYDDAEIAVTVVCRIDERDSASERPDGDGRPARELHRGPTLELETHLAPGRDERRVVSVHVELDGSVVGQWDQ